MIQNSHQVFDRDCHVMSGYQQGHYDDGYGHPAGHGDSYYQDDHAQGYYDHQGYDDGYYDQGYEIHATILRSLKKITWGCPWLQNTADDNSLPTVAIMEEPMALTLVRLDKATRMVDTTKAATTMSTMGISTTTKEDMVVVDADTTQRRTQRLSATSL